MILNIQQFLSQDHVEDRVRSNDAQNAIRIGLQPSTIRVDTKELNTLM